MEILKRINRLVGSRLSPSTTLWLRKLRRGEHDWQRRLPRFGAGSGGTSENGTLLESSYDVLRLARENLAAVRAHLDELGIEFIELPHWSPFRPRLVVSEAHAADVLAAVQQLPRENGWVVEVFDERHRSLPLQRVLSSWRAERIEDVAAIHVYRQVLAPSGAPVHSRSERVIIEPWRIAGIGEDRVDGGTHVPGTLLRRIQRRNTLMEYLTPEVRRSAVASGKRLEWDDPHLFTLTEPVDIVYTWVDGDDPAWQAKKNAHLTGTAVTQINETAASASRFVSRNELLYSLRSVEAYASWVNHIYLVTDGQTPEWLDTSHPKITVIDHRDIFKDPDVLPVFNSHAIESQLHHIPDLSERYLYMNDDVFFLAPVLPELFFTSNGMSRFFPSKAPLDVGDPSSDDMPVMSAAKQGRAFMRREHGRTVTNKFKHAPHPQLRSVLEEWEAEHPEVFERVARSKFRHPDDLSIASSLYHYHAYAEGRAVEGSIRYTYVDIAAPNAEMRLDWWLRGTKLDVICINDTSTPDDVQRVNAFLNELLERRFPIPSSFER